MAPKLARIPLDPLGPAGRRAGAWHDRVEAMRTLGEGIAKGAPPAAEAGAKLAARLDKDVQAVAAREKVPPYIYTLTPPSNRIYRLSIKSIIWLGFPQWVAQLFPTVS